MKKIATSIVLGLFFLIAGSRWLGAGEEISLRLTVPQALPLAGQPQALVAHVAYHGSQPRTASLRFYQLHGKKQTVLGAAHTVELKPGEAALSVRQEWMADATGEHVLGVRLEPVGAASSQPIAEASQTVIVVKRPLHFHQWNMDPALKYVTEGMVNDKKLLEYWADRGVIGQRWAGGKVAVDEYGKKTAAALGQYWTEPCKAGWPGVVIDEFFSTDDLLGRGLLEARKLEPHVYLAPYTVGMQGADVLRGFREASDRILLETYEGHAGYGYGRIKGAYQAAVDAGLGAKSLVALGAGPDWVSTPQELRRQLHFARYQFPDMPGFAVFGSRKELIPAINEETRRLYLGPVLRAEPLEGGLVRVDSIGGADAPATQIRLAAGTAEGPGQVDVPALAVGQSSTLKTGRKQATPVTQYRDDCPILGPPPLWDREPAEMRPNASRPWPESGTVVSENIQAFDTAPELELTRDQSAKPELRGNVVAGTYPIPPTDEKAFQLDFDLEMVDVRHYGNFTVSLVHSAGKSFLALGPSRGDYEPAPYLTLDITNPGDVKTHERIALPMEPGPYHIAVRYEPKGYVRVGIRDAKGKNLWDTGEVPTYGPLSFDRVRLGVQSGPGSALVWDAARQAMRLRGVMNPEYFMSGYVDNISMRSFTARSTPPSL